MLVMAPGGTVPQMADMVNWGVFQGAGIAIISVTGGALLQEFLVRRADRRERRVQFAHDTLLDLQAAIGDLAIAAEQIISDKRGTGTWQTNGQSAVWLDLHKARVLTIRYGVLVGDASLAALTRDLELSYTRMANAQSESDAAEAEPRARDLLRQTNLSIGNGIRAL
jgi:hypothetical protein